MYLDKYKNVCGKLILSPPGFYFPASPQPTAGQSLRHIIECLVSAIKG